MQAFTYNTVGQIALDWGVNRRLGPVLAEAFPARRLLLVTDSGLHRSGLLEPAKASLKAAGFQVTVFDAVVADPPEQLVLDCTALARAEGVGLVLGLGGGSSLDVAKLVPCWPAAISRWKSFTVLARCGAAGCLWYRCRPPPEPGPR